MDSTYPQSRVFAQCTTSNHDNIMASSKSKMIEQVASSVGELTESFKAINSQDLDFVLEPNTQRLATASESRKIDNKSPANGSDNTKDSGTHNTKDFNCPVTRKREQKRAWNLIYKNHMQRKFRTSPIGYLEQLRKPSCEPRGWVALSPAAKNCSDTYHRFLQRRAMQTANAIVNKWRRIICQKTCCKENFCTEKCCAGKTDKKMTNLDSDGKLEHLHHSLSAMGLEGTKWKGGYYHQGNYWSVHADLVDKTMCNVLDEVDLLAREKGMVQNWEAKSELAKKKRLEEIGTSLKATGWADENLRRAEMEEWSFEEQERLELARGSAIIDHSDEELDNDSDSDSDFDSDSDDENDFPHLYANIPTPSQTPNNEDNEDDFPHFCSSTTTPSGAKSLAEGSGIVTNKSKALFDLIKGPLTPPLTPILECSGPESSTYSIFDDEISYLEPGQPFDISQPSKFDMKRELTLITALINDLGGRLLAYQDLTDNIFAAALYNANPRPELLSVKSFCSWKLHPISEQFKETHPMTNKSVPDLRVIDPDGDIYSLEEWMDVLDEYGDRDFAQHLAERDEWQFQKEKWFVINGQVTDAENEARLQHLEMWYQEGRVR